MRSSRVVEDERTAPALGAKQGKRAGRRPCGAGLATALKPRRAGLPSARGHPCRGHPGERTHPTSRDAAVGRLRTTHGKRTALFCGQSDGRVAAARQERPRGEQSSGRDHPALEWAFLVPARPPTINPQGVRYASVRPLRLCLRGDRGRPRTCRRLSSGDSPRRKTGATRCRTTSPSPRTTPSTSPAR